jgi:hypothetical protein
LHDDGFIENCNSGQNAVTREKLNLGLFEWDSSPELNTKKLENSHSFPSVTYTASLDQWVRRYRILRIGKTAENWTVQQLEETKFLRLGKIETPGLANTILLDNSL